jgi:Nuclease A inhibitor-like protein
MEISERLEPLPYEHPDLDLLREYQQLVKDLYIYSESKYPYDVFIWDSLIHGELTDSKYGDFNFMAVVEKVFGAKIPISQTNLLQKKHRDYFEFIEDKLVNKKPLKFYRDQYYMLNRFLGRIYTDNGALSEDEQKRMRIFAAKIWTLQSNSVRVFEFDCPSIQQLLMGKTEHGNWLGVHTISVET